MTVLWLMMAYRKFRIFPLQILSLYTSRKYQYWVSHQRRTIRSRHFHPTIHILWTTPSSTDSHALAPLQSIRHSARKSRRLPHVVDRAVERERSFARRACQDGTIPIFDQSHQHRGQTRSMVGDFPALRRIGTIDCWALWAFKIDHLFKVLVTKY